MQRPSLTERRPRLVSRRGLRRGGLASLAALAALGLSAAPALAVQPSSVTKGHPELELGSGKNGALSQQIVWDQAPRALGTAWRAMRNEVGGDYRASFNKLTGTPSRLFGRGVPAGDAVSSPKTAGAFAHAFLDKHIALIAPGSTIADFDLVSNDFDATPRGDGLATEPMRTVGFQQFYVTPSGKRLEVRGGQVSFRFKNGQMLLIGSEALPMSGLKIDAPSAPIADVAITKAALAFVERDFGHASVVGSISEAFVLPFTNDAGDLDFQVVRSVVVETDGVKAPTALSPIGRFEVFVDARSGAVVARKQLLRFESGNVALHVTTRAPTFGPRIDVPAIDETLTVNGSGTATDLTGLVSFTGTPATVTAFSEGPDVSMTNSTGPKAQIGFSLADAGTFIWDASTDEAVDSQLDAFVHARQVREYAKTFAPGLSFLNDQVFVTVNINDICNAFSDGTNVNFFNSGSGCENTGRIADVVYHEFGHSIHNHAIIQGVGFWEGALSEGIADYLAGTITNDSGMGRGFFFTNEPLRELDPQDHKNHWPEDLVGEVHEDGKIIGQTLWELRKELVTKLGPVQGVAHADFLFYEGIRRAVDIPSMYPEVIAADDDDGNLENGTPNICEINRAFQLHGIRAYSADGSPLSLEPVKQDGYTVSAELHGLYAQCPDDALASATLKWRNQDQQAVGDTIPMQVNGSTLTGLIPTQKDGTVIQYSIDVAFAATNNIFLPNNPADLWYQFYIGDVTPLYCTDFETDPAAQGWTHGLSMGTMASGADDWEWGKPAGTTTNGDPTDAFSGKKVFGNDLGDLPNHDGLYQADKVNFAQSPMVDTTGYDSVRLQYRRWLNVEDGHFDHATIYANGQPAWTNADSNQGDNSKVDHTDREWRFHDVNLTPYVKNNQVQVKYELNSDPGKQLGGWTIDDFCVVGVKSAPQNNCPGPMCPGAGGSGAGGSGAGGSGGGLGGSNDDPAGGCGCTLASGEDETFSGAFALGALILGAAIRRRRR